MFLYLLPKLLTLLFQSISFYSTVLDFLLKMIHNIWHTFFAMSDSVFLFFIVQKQLPLSVL